MIVDEGLNFYENNYKNISAQLAFNQRNWGHRKNINQETLFDWRIHQNPFYTKFAKGLIAYKNGSVIGQIIPIFSALVSDTSEINCVWGSDYFVDQDYRNSMVGVMLLKSMCNSYVHFGVGMSETSLKIHKAFGEVRIGVRYDSLFVAGGQSKLLYKYISFHEFLKKFENYFSRSNFSPKVNYFKRSVSFYRWVFNKSNMHKIDVITSQGNNKFVIIYKKKIKGFPCNIVVDYSPTFHDDPEGLFDVLRYHGSKSFKKIYLFYGAVDLSKYVKVLRHKIFPVYSNIKKKKVFFNEKNELHITGVDSDRFISFFF